MVYRVFVEKRPAEALEARALLNDLRGFLGISGLTGLRIVNRYDAQNIDAELGRRVDDGLRDTGCAVLKAVG